MKLNIGGQQGKGTYEFPEGWTCIDLLPGADIICDIQKDPLPFEDESVETIYCSHVLEHLWPWYHIFTTREFLRVLKPGGKIQIVVPDMDIAIDRYITDRTGHNLVVTMNWWFSPIQANDGSVHFGHLCGFNCSLLESLLRQAGFKNIKKVKYGEPGEFFGCNNPNHEPTSLYVEAEK